MLDPPRAGAKGIEYDLMAFGAGKIIYVSCNPTTLARDLAAHLFQDGARDRHAVRLPGVGDDPVNRPVGVDAIDRLKRLQDRAYVKSTNLSGERLLGAADPGAVNHTSGPALSTSRERFRLLDRAREATRHDGQPATTLQAI